VAKGELSQQGSFLYVKKQTSQIGLPHSINATHSKFFVINMILTYFALPYEQSLERGISQLLCLHLFIAARQSGDPLHVKLTPPLTYKLLSLMLITSGKHYFREISGMLQKSREERQRSEAHKTSLT